MITCQSCESNSRYSDLENVVLTSDGNGNFKGFNCYHCKEPILLKEVKVFEPVTNNLDILERRK